MPQYSYLKEENCWEVLYDFNKIIKIDNEQLEKILNFNKKFIQVIETNSYPSYNINTKQISIFEFLYKLSPFRNKVIFKNNNRFDIRKENVVITTEEFYELTKDYNQVEYIDYGKIVTKGRYAGEIKNSICSYFDENLNKKIYLMMLNNNRLCKLCEKSLQIINDYCKKNSNDIIWTINNSDYILGNNNLYIHQIILDCYGNGKGTKTLSVDHINNNTLDNRFDNLRIATQKQQTENSTGVKPNTQKKRFSKKELPEGLTENMMKKYVYFNEEFYDIEKTKTRQFFRVENPKLSKPWISSKSNNVSIFEKLKEANKVAENLENGIFPEENKSKLPKYVSISERNGKKQLSYERRANGKRENLKMVMNDYSDDKLIDFVNKLRDKVKTKYEYTIEM